MKTTNAGTFGVRRSVKKNGNSVAKRSFKYYVMP
jgi:hypothetical protein